MGKIEEEEYVKEKKRNSKFVGVFYNEKTGKRFAARRSKNEKKLAYNGSYKNEETAAHASDTLARQLMANGKQNYKLKLNFPDDNTEVSEVHKRTKNFTYFGTTYNEKRKRWSAGSKTHQKFFRNGSYKDEETAAHASDTLARKLMANGEQNIKFNFPDDITEVHKEDHKGTTTSCNYVGLYYNEKSRTWFATRWSKKENKPIHNGSYKDEKTAAHASDTLARKLMANGEHHSLNFHDDSTEVHKEQKIKSSKYFGVSYNKNSKAWLAQRRSKLEKKIFTAGTYRDEETAAIASDTLARKLMANGDQNLKLNFPDEGNKGYLKQQQRNKRKRPLDFEYSQEDEINLEKFKENKSGNSRAFSGSGFKNN